MFFCIFSTDLKTISRSFSSIPSIMTSFHFNRAASIPANFALAFAVMNPAFFERETKAAVTASRAAGFRGRGLVFGEAGDNVPEHFEKAC
jgi:hypothetical protein